MTVDERYQRLFLSLPIAAWESDWTAIIEHLRAGGVNDAEALSDPRNLRLFAEAMERRHILDANPAAFELMGWETTERGLNWKVASIPQQSLLLLAQAVAPLIFGDQHIITVELRVIRTDGTPLDTLLRIARTPTWDSDHTVFTIVTNATAAKRAEREAVASKTYLDNLIDNANVLIVELDMDAHPRRMNRMGEMITGFTLDELRNRNWFATLAPVETRPMADTLLASLREGRMPPADEAPILHRDGTRRTIAWRNTYVRGEEEEPTGIICFGVDVTEARQLQESLRRSETLSAMGNLVLGVAHEVRNPLFGISATLDAYADELKKPGYEECAAALRSEVSRLSVLMQELLEFGKPSELHLAPASLHAIVASAIKDGRVENAVPVSLPRLQADAGRMRQVFENLIDNALSLSPADSKVRISASVTEIATRPWVQCSIEDNGPGFALQDLDRVFEPFFTRRHGGTGLGLSIVQRIVSEHMGRVIAANRAEGGAVVTILLPVAS